MTTPPLSPLTLLLSRHTRRREFITLVGGATGVYSFLSDLAAKRLGLLRELVPAAARIGLLVNPENANAKSVTREVTAAASAIGVQIELARASDSRAIEAAFPILVRKKGRCAPGRRRSILLQQAGPARPAGDAPCSPRDL
jgi:ABC transporter substrate binding protein